MKASEETSIPAGLDRIKGLMSWWGMPNVLEAGQIEAQGKRFQGLVVDLVKLFNEAFSNQAQALSASNERFTRAFQDLLRAREPPELMAAQSSLVHVGHLGIFVSASVARFEHRAILENLGDIEALAPGLYEMKISNPTGDPDCRKPQHSVAFEERRVEDLIFDYPREAFERVRQVSDTNEALYRSFVSPWVQAASTPWSAAMLKWLHPMRTSRYLLSVTLARSTSSVASFFPMAMSFFSRSKSSARDYGQRSKAAC